MAVSNSLLLVEQRLWAIALAWPGLTTGSPRALLMPGNVVRYDQTAVRIPPAAAKAGKTPDSSITVSLDIASSRPESESRDPYLLCGGRAFGIGQVAFEWELTSNDLRLNDITQVLAELHAAMRSTDATPPLVPAGGQLGIPNVVARWDWSWRDATKNNDSKRRILATQTVVVK